MLNLKIDISGKTESDLAIALEEVLKKVEDGFTSGFDRNNSGRFSFQVEGEEELNEDEDE